MAVGLPQVLESSFQLDGHRRDVIDLIPVVPFVQAAHPRTVLLGHEVLPPDQGAEIILAAFQRVAGVQVLPYVAPHLLRREPVPLIHVLLVEKMDDHPVPFGVLRRKVDGLLYPPGNGRVEGHGVRARNGVRGVRM